jgi:hypothetical protein
MELKTRFLALVLLAVLAVSLASAQTTSAGAPRDLNAFTARVLKEFEVPGSPSGSLGMAQHRADEDGCRIAAD